MIHITQALLFALILSQLAFSDIITPQNQLKFKINNQVSATLTQSGFSVGSSSPSANLQNSGNLITDDLIINNNIYHTYASISSNSQIGQQHLSLVDSSSQDIELELNHPLNLKGSSFIIKKTTSTGNLFITSENLFLIDGHATILLEDRQFVEVISDGSEWHVIGGSYSTLSSDNLALHWKLDSLASTQIEENGTGYSLNVNASVAAANLAVEGLSGNGVYVDSDGQWISNTSFNDSFSLGNEMTVSTWLKFEETPFQRGNNAVIFMFVNSNNDFRYIVQTDGDISTTATTVGNYNFTDGEWYLFTYVEDGTNTHFYVNDTLVGSLANAPGEILMDDFYLGRACCSNMTDGTFDDVRIYNKALSSAEIKLLYLSQGK